MSNLGLLFVNIMAGNPALISMPIGVMAADPIPVGMPIIND